MICVRVDFHSRVIFTRVNKIQAMYERLCVNAKIEPSLNFYVYGQTFIHILYFIYVRKINARTHVKITRRWKPTLRCLSHTGHCLIFDWRVLSPKSRTFSPNDIYLYLSLCRMAVERDWRISLCFGLFFFIKLACWRVEVYLYDVKCKYHHHRAFLF